MLASIHPLGERSRKQRWGVTVAAYLAGTLLASSLVGGLLGVAGGLIGLPGDPPRAAAALAVAGVAAVGLVLDLRLGGLRVPTIQRQVDEQWLQRYRGWVYGFSFGFQLGLGVVTVVNSFTTYLALALAFMSGSAVAGVAIGTVFGIVRGLMILTVAGVREPHQLRSLHRRLQTWRPISHRLAVGVQGLVAAAGALVAFGA